VRAQDRRRRHQGPRSQPMANRGERIEAVSPDTSSGSRAGSRHMDSKPSPCVRRTDSRNRRSR
jgi:hypothetical protein